MEKELQDVRSVERLACVNLEVASARMKTLKEQVKGCDKKYAGNG